MIAISTLFGMSYLVWLNGWWVPVAASLLAFIGSVASITIFIAYSASGIRKVFGRYLTDQVVAKILENPSGLNMGGERREVTILVSDIRGFTTIAERISPEEAIKILNFYFEHMVDVITKYQGTIDEFMGDGILVLFGAPIDRDNDPDRAVACALEMQLALYKINQQINQWGFSGLEMGIGINTGEAIVGNIGSEKRTKYGVVGSQVNLTYRIESQTVGGQILISQTTLDKLQSHNKVSINEIKQVSLKGVKEPVVIYDIVGIQGNYNLQLTQQGEHFVNLNQSIPIQYSILDEKVIGATWYRSNIVGLSSMGAKILLSSIENQTILTKLTNVKLIFKETDNPVLEGQEVYAKVLDIEKEAFYIRFTARTVEVEAELNSLSHKIGS
jgi:adenylate cyclase